jgi:cytochrome c oxidase assembly protein subunit 11
MSVTAGTVSQKNLRVVIIMFGIVAGMVGLAYASVPLYDLFCRVTGFGGTTQISELAPGAAAGAVEREIRFNRKIDSDLDWSVKIPDLARIVPGEEIRVNYIAINTTDVPVTGTSSFNVTPNKVGQYFMKIECFCFTEQTLQPGERVEMPVVFYLDPDIDEDINTKATPEITLSYTFFPVDTDEGA